MKLILSWFVVLSFVGSLVAFLLWFMWPVVLLFCGFGLLSFVFLWAVEQIVDHYRG